MNEYAEMAMLIAKREYAKKYRATHREKLRAYEKQWHAKHPGKAKEYQNRHWAKKAVEMGLMKDEG